MGRGGKTLSDKQVFEGGFESRLVALDREQIVSASFVEHLLRGLILGVHRVQEGDLAEQVLPAQQ